MSTSATSLLIQRARSGDNDAWAEIDRRYRPLLGDALSAALRNKLGHRFDTEDVLQSTLLQAWESLATFEDRGPGSLALWLHTIALNRLRDNLRRLVAKKRDLSREVTRDRTAHLNDAEAVGPTPIELVERSESYLQIVDALQTLDELPRVVVHMHDLAQQDWGFIERTLELAPGTARRIHARAIGEVQRKLKRVRSC